MQEHLHVASIVEAIPNFGIDLAVALCAELGSRLGTEEMGQRFKKELASLKVPTTTGRFMPASSVFINDAPWIKRGAIETLDERVSNTHGRVLGCTSVRDQHAQQCEDGIDDEDAFGQESDLVDQVRLILKDYDSSSDVVAEFAQNTDDFGASKLSFILCDKTFEKEKLVDERCGDLQGPALYICSCKPLQEEDIKRMQRVGSSAKRLDFASIGRFGVGMNVMYRYTDCPQLYANGRLHFFDLTRKYVAADQKRGRKFKREELQARFPDSFAPFSDFVAEYPVVFRLPLRLKKSDLGEAMEVDSVQRDLPTVFQRASSMLLFTKSLKDISFRGLCGVKAEHKVLMDDQTQRDQKDFWSSLPSQLSEIFPGQDKKLCIYKSITSQFGAAAAEQRSWVVAHTLALSSESLCRIQSELFACHVTSKDWKARVEK